MSENVYNADEIELLWKLFSRKTLLCQYEHSAPSHKIRKDTITAVVCANASGSYELPVLVIEKNNKPRCLKHVNLNAMLVMYLSQRNSWMDTNIFMKWFSIILVPAVKERQLSAGRPQKTPKT